MLTNKQNQLLNFLILRIEQDGVSPSYEEICLELNLKSKSGIHRIVKALEERGYIEHLENKARAIAPTKYPNGQPYISNVIDINKLLHPKERDSKATSWRANPVDQNPESRICFFPAKTPEKKNQTSSCKQHCWKPDKRLFQ